MTATVTPEDLTADAWRLRPDTLAEAWSDGTWEAAEHHRLLATEIVECITTPGGRLVVEMPPRYGKSELVSYYTPAWVLQLDPTQKILLASYEKHLASEWGGRVRDLLVEKGFPYGVEIAVDTRAKDSWRTLQGGGMWTAGLGGPFTGRGGNVVIIDDPVKNWMDATSFVKRESAWNWYTSVARTRLAPGASIIVVQTRWHEDDLAGRLERHSDEGTGEKFKVLRLPAIAEEHEDYPISTRRRFVRKPGDALWPAWFSPEEVASTKLAVGVQTWAALFQQRPAPLEGGLFKRAWWQYYTALPDPLGRDGALISVDCAFKDLDASDYVVMQVWWKYGTRKYLIDQVRDRMSFVDTVKTLKALAFRHPECRTILVEDSANGPAVISELRDKVAGVVPRPAVGSKESRATATTGDVESRNVYLPDPSIASWIHDFVEELAAFNNGPNDDQVDAFTQAMLEWPNRVQSGQGEYSALDLLRGRGARG